MTLEQLLNDDCGKLAKCPDGCCMTCLHCIGRRLENMMQLFGDDWLGALACLSGYAPACGLTCARGHVETVETVGGSEHVTR